MAMARTHSKESYLNRLADDQITIDYQDFVVPRLEEIEPNEVEFIVDVDLDELAVHFSDKRKPHTIETSGDESALMVSAESDKVVGVVLSNFYDRLLMQFPSLISVLRLTTVLAGDTISEANASADSKSEALSEFAAVIGLQ